MRRGILSRLLHRNRKGQTYRVRASRFGANDEDWQVYEDMSHRGGGRCVRAPLQCAARWTRFSELVRGDGPRKADLFAPRRPLSRMAAMAKEIEKIDRLLEQYDTTSVKRAYQARGCLRSLCRWSVVRADVDARAV